ncbi:MAG: glycoside hydrolase family 3 protein [Firmicutes bacterium]|nr:glycoside hydrolase family 3 protein [Bacillota bacterium]
MGLDKMDSLIGKLFIIGFNGRFAEEDFLPRYRRIPAAGVILFGRNLGDPDQIRSLTATIEAVGEEAHGIPPFIGIDQEGGNLSPLRGFVASLPGNMGLAATGEISAARYAGRKTAEELRELGFNLVFAPVLDLATNPANPVIGTRAFSDDPEIVAAFGEAFAHGLMEGGVAFTAKHFPGHGSCREDSHVTLPFSTVARASLWEKDLRPFKKVLGLPGASVMTAHVRYAALDLENPATLSAKIIRDLLRREMGFEGVVITDDLEMGAIVERYSVPVAAVMALKAGADILLFRYNHDYQAQAIDAILDAVRSGEIPLERIEQSVERILQVKAIRGIVDRAAAPPQDAAQLTGRPESIERVRQISSRAVTLVRDEGGLVPLPQGSGLRVLNPALGEIARAEPLVRGQATLAAELRRRGVALDESAYTLWASDDEIKGHIRAAGTAERLVLATYDLARYPRQRILVEQVLALGKPVVAVALRSPYDLMYYRDVPAYLVTYGYRPALVAAAADILAGRARPKGRLPVDLPGLYPAGHGIVR